MNAVKEPLVVPNYVLTLLVVIPVFVIMVINSKMITFVLILMSVVKRMEDVNKHVQTLLEVLLVLVPVDIA